MAIIDVIKYEPKSDVLVFKHPTVDFNKKAKLIVHEKQEAIVFLNGQAKELYGSGKHELQSKNLPGVKHVLALFSGGELANHCEVFFINKLLFSNIPWVTSTMDIQDRTMGNYHSFWAQGFFTVRISNSSDLFDVIGGGLFLTTDDLKELFKERITSAARENLSIAMNQEGLSYGEINSHLTNLSERVMSRISPQFEKIGLSLDEFRFDSVNMIKDAEYDKHRSQLTERGAQQIVGTTHDKERMYDIMEKQAENPGTPGTTAGVMAGAGFGLSMGQVYGGMVGAAAKTAFSSPSPFSGGVHAEPQQNHNAGIIQPHPVSDQKIKTTICKKCHKELNPEWACCPYCGTSIQEERTCPSCGAPLPNVDGIKFCPNCSNPMK